MTDRFVEVEEILDRLRYGEKVPATSENLISLLEEIGHALVKSVPGGWGYPIKIIIAIERAP